MYFSPSCRMRSGCFSRHAETFFLERLPDPHRQAGQQLLEVAHQRDGGGDELRDLGWIDVEVDDLRLGRERGELARDAIVEARPERDDEVRVLDRVVGVARAVHAEHAEARRVRLGEGALPVQRRHHRRADELAELEHLGERVAGPHATAEVDDRARGGADERGRLGEPRLLLQLRHVPGDVNQVRVLEVEAHVEHVLRNVDVHRARTAGPRQVEGLLHHARDVLRIGHQVVVLRHRHRDAGDVRLLEGVAPDERRRDVGGDDHQRDRVHVGVGDGGDEVRRPWPARAHADAHLARGLGVALGGVTAHLLVADQHVLQLLGAEQRVVDGQDRPTRHPEDPVHAFQLERPDHRLGTRHLLARHRTSTSCRERV